MRNTTWRYSEIFNKKLPIPKITIPKIPTLKKNTNLTMNGMLVGILSVTNISHLKDYTQSKQKVTTAGRGGKYYSIGSHYSKFN